MSRYTTDLSIFLQTESTRNTTVEKLLEAVIDADFVFAVGQSYNITHITQSVLGADNLFPRRSADPRE